MKNLRRTVCTLLFGSLLLAGCGGDDDYADRMAEEHADDTTQAATIPMEPMIPVTAQPEVYGEVDGQQLRGYMAVPERPDSVLTVRGMEATAALPAVLLVHEWWGLNENIEVMARRLAGEGYRVLAVDLYGGQVAATPEEARALVEQARQDEAAIQANMLAAYQYLTQQLGAPRVGVMGWCFGGSVTLTTALAMPTDLDAAVIYYGDVGGVEREALQALEMPVIGFFGAEDQGIPVEDARQFEQTMQELGKDVEVHVYENAGHAFANPTGNNYVEEAARAAWDETKAFLLEHLYPNTGEVDMPGAGG